MNCNTSLRTLLLAVAFGLSALAACRSTQTSPQLSASTKTLSRHGDKAIVFIHGVFGDLEGTWRNSRTAAFFPELVIDDPDMQGFDALLVGFDSPLLGRAQTLEELSAGVFQRLTDENLFSKYREIYFVAHSMGGLITQRVLTTLNTPANVDALRRVKAVVLLSTPSNGASIAELGSYISANPQLHDMAPATLNSWIQSVQNDVIRLRVARDSLGNRYPRMFAAYETLPTGPVMIVDRVYASTPSDQAMMAFHRNHAGIVKPQGRDDDVYKWVKARIRGESRSESAIAAPLAADFSQGQEEWTDLRVQLKSAFPNVSLFSKTFTPDSLKARRTRVLILPLPYHQLLSEEKAREIRGWVEDGGGLLLLGYYAADLHHGTNPTKLASMWGIQFGPHVLLPDSLTNCEAARGHAIGTDPAYAISAMPVDTNGIFAGVRELALVSSTSLSVSSARSPAVWTLRSPASTRLCKAVPIGGPRHDGEAYPVNFVGDGQRSTPVAVGITAGLGRVAVIGTWKVATLRRPDNITFLNNVVAWLSRSP